MADTLKKRPLIKCDASNAPKHNAAETTRCGPISLIDPGFKQNNGAPWPNEAVTHKGRLELASTIMHEMQHYDGMNENLIENSHNDPDCQSFDAVYGCTKRCFKDAQPAEKYEAGCKACVKDSLKASCGTSSSFDESSMQPAKCQGRSVLKWTSCPEL